MNLTDSPPTTGKTQRPPVVPTTLTPDAPPARAEAVPAWGAATGPAATPLRPNGAQSATPGNGHGSASSANSTSSSTTPSSAQAAAPGTATSTGASSGQASASTRAAANQASAAPVADPRIKQKGEAKTARIPIKIIPIKDMLRKPEWIRKQAPKLGSRYYEMKEILRDHKLHTVCEEASCPNIGECFGKGTASFMIMGDKCTRRCPFCDVGHGRPDPLDQEEPYNLAMSVKALRLKYVVITSVDRDDLRDGGAGHYANCIREIRRHSPLTQIEILVPDFRGRLDKALDILDATPPDVMNHNLETVPRLYRQARPGANYEHSLKLLRDFKIRRPGVPSKSGLMVGLGETDEEILQVMRDMREHDIDRLTIGQYLAPSRHHLPVERYVTPETFKMFEEEAYKMGFQHAAVGAMVRSSYHADMQAEEAQRNSTPKTSCASSAA